LFCSFLFSLHCVLRFLHSFPTRRSSDLVERGGKVRSFHVPSVSAKTLAPILKSQIAADANLMTDEASMYTVVGREFASHNVVSRSEEHTSELQSRENLVCRLLLEKKNTY